MIHLMLVRQTGVGSILANVFYAGLCGVFIVKRSVKLDAQRKPG